MALDDAKAGDQSRLLSFPGGLIPPGSATRFVPGNPLQVQPRFLEPAGSELEHAQNTVC